MIELGNKVRDTVTGFTGIVVGKTIWMYGCERFAVQSDKLHDNKPVDEHWFDDQRLEVLEITEPVVSPSSVATSGGPQRDPSR